MATALLMPKQGNSVESCLILEWMKKEGDRVNVGDVVCEAETDKATIEVESTAEGTILKIFYGPDTEVPVQKMMAVIGEPGEDISSFEAEFAASGDGASASAPAAAQAAPAVNSTGGDSFVSPRARNLAAGKGFDASGLAGSGPGGRVIERDVLGALAGKEPLTPAAVAAAIEQGLTAPAEGTGIGGRVRLQDLSSAPAASTAAGTAASASAALPFPGAFRDEKVKGVRKITAARMMESLSMTAQLTHNFTADATELLAYRAKFKNSPEELGLGKVSINDIVMFAASRVLKLHPEFNCHWLGDTMRYFDSVHLGFACDTPKGLLVPVIKNADSLSLKELSAEAARLIAACREGKAQPDELTGATFTLSNVGAFGIDSFTPIINPPEIGILGVCSTQLKPVRTANGVEYRDHIGFSLTYDHQAADGAPASKFCADIRTAVENIGIYLAL